MTDVNPFWLLFYAALGVALSVPILLKGWGFMPRTEDRSMYLCLWLIGSFMPCCVLVSIIAYRQLGLVP
jgi:hypothetical protein